MDRPLALILTFLAFMAYVHHINAGIVKLNALPSRSLPVYSTKNEGSSSLPLVLQTAFFRPTLHEHAYLTPNTTCTLSQHLEYQRLFRKMVG